MYISRVQRKRMAKFHQKMVLVTFLVGCAIGMIAEKLVQVLMVSLG